MTQVAIHPAESGNSGAYPRDLWPVVTGAEMQAIDAAAQAPPYSVAGWSLMQAAGQLLARHAMAWAPAGPVTVWCGAGNNGGDGLVAAEALHRLGRDVTVLLLRPPEAFRGDAATAMAAIQAAGVPTLPLFSDAASAAIDRSVAAVDALLGIGLRGPATGEYDRALSLARHTRARQPLFTIAADVPSGVGDFDASDFPLWPAQVTVTFGLPKRCLVQGPGHRAAGRVLLEPLHFPPELLQAPGADHACVATHAQLARLLPPRPEDGHKGTFGRLGVLAGSPDYAGAAILCTRAALRSGVGLAFLYGDPELNTAYKVAIPEAVTRPVLRTAEALAMLPAIITADRITALVLGPGLGNSAAVDDAVRHLLDTTALPCVVDADALRCLREQRGGADRCLITPHAAELARMLGVSTEAVLADRPAAAREAARRWNATVLLKGPDTVIAEPSGRLAWNPGACAALAKGGSGDVLSGLAGALLAQGLPPFPAALLATRVHLLAGIRQAKIRGTRGVLAHEVADEIPLVFDALESDLKARSF